MSDVIRISLRHVSGISPLEIAFITGEALSWDLASLWIRLDANGRNLQTEDQQSILKQRVLEDVKRIVSGLHWHRLQSTYVMGLVAQKYASIRWAEEVLGERLRKNPSTSVMMDMVRAGASSDWLLSIASAMRGEKGGFIIVALADRGAIPPEMARKVVEKMSGGRASTAVALHLHGHGELDWALNFVLQEIDPSSDEALRMLRRSTDIVSKRGCISQRRSRDDCRE